MLFLWALCVLGAVAAQDGLTLDPEYVVVNISDGAIRGRGGISKSGTIFYKFKGIPYAKPPVGPLRFEPSQPPEPWTGIRDALVEGDRCFQYRLDSKVYQGSEDCLYINVYTPRPPANITEPLPVMAWIHPGGYVWGAGDEAHFGPEFLLNEEVIYVNFNYRLNVLGFLCLNDATVVCNNGLKDQVRALHWIQDNIAQFGGDPKQVTLFGVSSGAGAVNQHMLSPLSDGLFSKAISQSGAAFSPWAIEFHPRRTAFRLGSHVGFNGTDPQELVDYLRGVDFDMLVEAADRERDIRRLLSFAFVPVIEPEVPGVDRFITDHPLKLLEAGQFKSVPFISGITSKEGIMELVWFDLNNTRSMKRLDDYFEIMLMAELRFSDRFSNKSAVAARFRDFYFQGKPVSRETLDNFIDLYSDLHFGEAPDKTVRVMSQFNKAPLYYYMFSLDGRLNNFKYEFHLDYYPGACHGDEQGHMYRISVVDPDLERNAPEVHVRSQVVKMWTNFAKFGNPTPEVTELLPVKWEQYNPDTQYYMDIDRELTLKSAPYGDRMEFFADIYKYE